MGNLSASVVVSCYNQKNYIVECLDSIVSQEVDFDYELIVSDDFSTDGTQEILENYVASHEEKIKLCIQKYNVGAAVNYLDVHNAATGDIVYHIDGDDVLLPGKLQKQYDVFCKNPDVNVVFHKANYFSDDGSYSKDTQFPVVGACDLLFFSLSDLACWGTVAVHSSYAYRRNSRNIKFLDREFMEWFFAMDSLKYGGRGVFLNSVFIKYRFNVSGTSYLSSRSGKIKAYDLYLLDLKSMFDAIEDSSVRCGIYSNYLLTLFSRIKAIKYFPVKDMFFLIRNIVYFRPLLLVKSFKVRSKVGPGL